ncbi:hypothetical protein EDD15DRAFT_2243493 [Pisolithus albus]|nr:hypothetical protein EDD15DRAFT_2243493 [Pisolithus albus]
MSLFVHVSFFLKPISSLCCQRSRRCNSYQPAERDERTSLRLPHPALISRGERWLDRLEPLDIMGSARKPIIDTGAGVEKQWRCTGTERLPSGLQQRHS